MKRTVFLMVLGSIHAGLAMAATEPSPASQPAATPPTTSAPVVLGADGSPVLAYFGEEEMTQAEIDKLIGLPTSRPDVTEEMLHQRRQEAIAQLSLQHLYRTYRDDNPGFVTDEAMDKEFAQLQERLDKAGRTMESLLEQFNMTEAELRDRLSLEVLDRTLVAKATSEERVTAYYEAHKDEFDGTKVTVKHILIRVHPIFGTPADHEAAKAKLVAAKKEIVAGTLTFDEAMRRDSQDPSSAVRPELGPFSRHGMMAESFAKAAFALKPDEISDPVKTQFGYHLIQCLSRTTGEPQPLEQAKPIINRVLANEAREEMLEGQRAKHSIRILLPYIEPPPPPMPRQPTTRPQATRPAPATRRPQPQTQPAADRTQPRPLPPGGPTAPPAP